MIRRKRIKLKELQKIKYIRQHRVRYVPISFDPITNSFKFTKYID